MRIVTLKELCKLPKGTMFCEYTPEIYLSEAMIRTWDSDENGHFNGVVNLLPFWNYEHDRFEDVNWDCSSADYKEDDLFVVFDKQEIKDMIDRLMFALSDGEIDYEEYSTC